MIRSSLFLLLLATSCTLTRSPKSQVECHCNTDEAGRKDGHVEEDAEKTDAKLEGEIDAELEREP
jgi:hypothetical protein